MAPGPRRTVCQFCILAAWYIDASLTLIISIMLNPGFIHLDFRLKLRRLPQQSDQFSMETPPNSRGIHTYREFTLVNSPPCDLCDSLESTRSTGPKTCQETPIFQRRQVQSSLQLRIWSFSRGPVAPLLEQSLFFFGGGSQDGKVCVIPKDFGGSLEGYDEWQLAAMFFPFRGLIFQMSASQCEKRGIDDG